jgi:hypothetical protein
MGRTSEADFLMATFQPSVYSNPGLTLKPGQTSLASQGFTIQVNPDADADAEEKPPGQEKPPISGAALGLGIAGVAGLILVGPFMITPWIVKQFKPEWPYGKRVATGFVVSFGLGALTTIAKAASGGGKED